jgi:hypothetical protein
LIEEGFIQMYTRDFAALAAKAESGVEVEPALRKRISETRTHAVLMDSRKGDGHLSAVAERLRLESRRKDALHQMRPGADPAAALARREAFLVRVADLLDADPEMAVSPGMAVRP